MADNNLKDFSINWILFGLLFFSLLSFTISFMFYNNPTGLGDSASIFDDTAAEYESKLMAIPEDSDVLLNITSETNPEVSDLGSRDSVATSYGTMGNSRGFFVSAKIFMGWILTGVIGDILLAVFSGLFGFTALYFIVKWVRNGI